MLNFSIFYTYISMKNIKLKKAHIITAKKKIQQLVKMTNGIIGIETLKIELFEKGDDMNKEPAWFRKFRIQNEKRWEANEKRWEVNDKLWAQQLNFNKEVTKFIKTITALPIIKKELIKK